MTLALIDGDICAYRAAAVKTDGMEDESGCAGPPEPLHPAIAADIAANIVEQWMKKADCTTCIVAISGDHNFRKTIMPSYKSNRSGTAKPLHLSTVRRSLMNRFDHRVVDGLEADDLLGILAGRRGFEEAIIVSPDKDLLTIPGRHLNPFKDDPIVVTTEAQADYRWMLQTLMGDTSDGYSGIPRVGVKKAGVILQGLRTLPAMWRAVAAAYRDAKLPEANALMTARVARILRTADYDKSTKEIVLWHPVTPQRVALKEITQ